MSVTQSEKLPRNVVILSWVSLFQDAASEMLYPVMPLFLTGVLGAPVAVVGLIEGVAEATASIMKAISGRLADFRRRKPLVFSGYGVSAISKAIIGLATGWPFVLAMRVTDRFGKGLRDSPRDALIAAETAPDIRGRAFGFHRAFDTTGAVMGPLLGLGLYELLHHELRPVFFVAFVPAAISVILTLFVREHRGTGEAKRNAGRQAMPAHYWRVLAFLAVFGLANFSDALIILRVKALGFGFVGVILVYSVYNTLYALLSYPAGRLSDRMPRRVIFGVGLAIFAAAYLGLGATTSRAWAWGLMALYGVYTALTDGVGKAWISSLVPREAVGTGLGLYMATSGITALIAGVWAGLAWHGDGRLPLTISGSVVAVLAVVLLAGGRRLEAVKA